MGLENKHLYVNDIRMLDNCLKIGKANAKAMIDGFKKDKKLLHQSIYCFNRERPFHFALMVVDSGRSRYKLSSIGNDLNSDDFTIENKYLITVVKSESINDKNKMELWDDICTNDLFDIWDPSAPFKKYNDNKNSKQFCIGLLRIFELEDIIPDNLINVNPRNATLKESVKIKIKRPIIDDVEFNEIRNKLEKSLAKKL